MKLPLAYYGDPILRQKAKLVDSITDDIRRLIADMSDTIGVNLGLAAPQVKQSLRIFLVCIPEYDENWRELAPGKLEVFINPKLSLPSGERVEMEEGCLSLPCLRVPVTRPAAIHYETMTLEGVVVEGYAVGLRARAIMHENDHLNGKLTIDHLHGRARQYLNKDLNEIKKRYYLGGQIPPSNDEEV